MSEEVEVCMLVPVLGVALLLWYSLQVLILNVYYPFFNLIVVACITVAALVAAKRQTMAGVGPKKNKPLEGRAVSVGRQVAPGYTSRETASELPTGLGSGGYKHQPKEKEKPDCQGPFSEENGPEVTTNGGPGAEKGAPEGDASRINELTRLLGLFFQGVPAEKTLAQVIVKKTEEATLELTEHVYGIAESSKKVGNNLHELLTNLCTGDDSLETDAVQLERDIDKTKDIVVRLREVNVAYETDMTALENAVKEIGQFASSIGDLSERTNVLAINASIEAARVGSRGQGFGVIAGEIQKLARSSTEIAVNIGSVIQETVDKVNSSFARQNSSISGGIQDLETRQKALQEVVQSIPNRIEMLVTGASSAENLAADVVNELNQVTRHLQYQDMVRQVLEHMVAFLEDISSRFQNWVNDGVEHGDIDQERAKLEVEEMITRLFTTHEEWDAFGLDPDASIGGSPVSDKNAAPQIVKRDEDFEGDVTLF